MAMAADEKESYGQALAQAEDDTDLVDKLMKKIAVQAIQLGNLGNAFNGSAEYIELCESKIKELEIAARLQHFNKEAEHDHSEGATKRQDELSARLQEVESLLISKDANIGELERNLRAKERHCKLNDKKVLELGREIQNLKAQIATFQHLSRLAAKPTGPVPNPKLVSGLKTEIEALKTYLSSCQTRLEASKENEHTLTAKVTELEAERKLQPHVINEKNLVRVRALSEKVKKLKLELKKEKEIKYREEKDSKYCLPFDSIITANEDAEKGAGKIVDFVVTSSPKCSLVDDVIKSGISSVTSSNSNSSNGENRAALERVIVSLQLQLDESGRQHEILKEKWLKNNGKKNKRRWTTN